jgi:DNA invertase Pin-like site-specific DNA recombinase
MAEANDILTDLRGRGVLFGLGASVYDWNDPFGRLFLQTLAMVAEFEANLNHLRTARAWPSPNARASCGAGQAAQAAQRSIQRRHAAGESSLADLDEEYSVAAPPSTASSTVATQPDPAAVRCLRGR